MNKIEDAIKEHGYFVSTTSGLSMWPMLRDRQDTIVIYPCEGRLRRYDVPLYRRGDNYVLHRIIGVKEDEYIICGDNCIEKEHVKDEQIIGVLKEFYRKDRKIDMNGIGYRFYVKIWWMLYPVRRLYKYLRGKFMRLMKGKNECRRIKVHNK